MMAVSTAKASVSTVRPLVRWAKALDVLESLCGVKRIEGIRMRMSNNAGRLSPGRGLSRWINFLACFRGRSSGRPRIRGEDLLTFWGEGGNGARPWRRVPVQDSL